MQGLPMVLSPTLDDAFAPGRARRDQAWQLAGTAFGAGLLLSLGSDQLQVGLNLATAEAGVALAALTLLVGALRRLAW